MNYSKNHESLSSADDFFPTSNAAAVFEAMEKVFSDKQTKSLSRCISGFGSGAGKGGGGGGSIREAGGRFGEMGAINEEGYFRKLQKMQLEKLRVNVIEEVETAFHEKQIKRHKEAIANRKKRLASSTVERKKVF